MGTTFSDTWANADHIMEKSDIHCGQASWFSWIFPSPGWLLNIHHFEPEPEWIQAVETPLDMSSKEGKTNFICRKGDGFRFLRMKRALCLLTILKDATTSMKNTIPTFSGNHERLSRPNIQKMRKQVLFHWDNASAHIVASNGCSAWLLFWNGWSASPFSWYGSI